MSKQSADDAAVREERLSALDIAWLAARGEGSTFEAEGAAKSNRPRAKFDQTSQGVLCFIGNFVAFPFVLLWNIVVVCVAVVLQVIWLAFLFGSVLGVVLLLIFWPGAFLLPLALLSFMAPWWGTFDS